MQGCVYMAKDSHFAADGVLGALRAHAGRIPGVQDEGLNYILKPKTETLSPEMWLSLPPWGNHFSAESFRGDILPEHGHCG